MAKDYIDRCFCGYWLTQEEIDTEQCPECDGSLSDRWEAWEEKQINEVVKPTKAVTETLSANKTKR